MKNIILLVCVLSAVCLTSQGFVAPICASPFVQDKDRDELEQMILKKIEQRKKEMEAEKGKKGTSSRPKTGSFKPTKPKSTPYSNRSASPASSSRVRSTKSESPRRTTGNSAKAAETSGSATVVAPPRVRPTAKEPEFTQPTQLSIPSPSGIDPNVKISFSFQDEEWNEILKWFADEIGFGLFYGQTGAPTGTHTYVDQNQYTLIEALDKLNSWLGIMEPSHVLVRNGNLLILINESGIIPESILPFVTPDQLVEYSKYEVVRCKFNLDKLNGNVLATQLRENISQVHLDGFSYVEAANNLIVRERVRVLREINTIIEEARRDTNPRTITTFGFQHADPETALITIREVLGFAENVNETEDGSLRFALSPANQKVYLTGTADMIQRFQDIAEMLDAPVGDDNLLPDKPYTRKHSVSGDVEVVFQIVQTFLDGELNVRMDQDSVTGDLYISATKDVHDRVSELLNTIGGGTDTFDIVPVANVRPADVVDTIEELLGIDTFSDEVSNGPRLIADGDNDRVLIYGTPQQRVEVRRMIEQLDQEESGTAKARRRIRVIPMSPRDAENVINYMEIDGIMDSIGRKNRLNIITPQDRKRFLNRNRRSEQPQESGTEGSQNRNDERSSSREFRTRIGSYRSNRSNRSICPSLKTTGAESAYYASTFVQEPASDERLGTVSGVGQKEESLEPQEFNVPGADIKLKWVDQGLVIETDDLDAADDLEDLFDEIIGGTGQPEFPSFIGVEYRDVNEVKALLDHILGLASSSGGGGGGGGLMNLVGDAMSNAMGGAAGGALGGLLGGGGGSGFSDSTEGAVELEGEDVSITVDGRTNSLIVIGATVNDLDFIIELVEVVDVDSPPHKPALLGRTYVIPVENRDPMYVKEKIEMQLSGYFRNTQSNPGSNNQQNPEQAIQRAVLQQLQGGGGRRGGRGGNAAAGGANNANSEAPKATLGIDEENGTLLLTGPKSIYEEVYDLVKKLDIKKEIIRELERVDFLSIDAVINDLKAVFGDKIEIVVDEEEEAAPGGAAGGATRTATRGGANRGATGGRNAGGGRTPSPAELNRSIRDAVRNGGGGGGGGGRNIQRGGRGR